VERLREGIMRQDTNGHSKRFQSSIDPSSQKTEEFDYPFDDIFIAPAPLKNRSRSRLLIYNRETGEVAHQRFSSMINWLRPNDLVIVNNTKVFPARIKGRKAMSNGPATAGSPSTAGGPATASGGMVELLLLRPDQDASASLCWEVLVKGHLSASTTLILDGGGRARLMEAGEGMEKKICFELPAGETIYSYLEKWGEVPVPPYILRRRKMLPREKEMDEGRETALINPNDADGYQTVYATEVGSAAAPTAGLHFTKRLLSALQKKGVKVATVTLHIGTDTFRPISAALLDEHKMSGERFEIPEETVYALAEARRLQGRIVAVGTSAMRALESASDGKNGILNIKGETGLFITPGYRFRVVDVLVTNLHPPRSTGLVLVSAFAGRENILRIYQKAMEKRYRFFTYGDAMLIL